MRGGGGEGTTRRKEDNLVLKEHQECPKGTQKPAAARGSNASVMAL